MGVAGNGTLILAFANDVAHTAALSALHVSLEKTEVILFATWLSVGKKNCFVLFTCLHVLLFTDMTDGPQDRKSVAHAIFKSMSSFLEHEDIQVSACRALKRCRVSGGCCPLVVCHCVSLCVTVCHCVMVCFCVLLYVKG